MMTSAFSQLAESYDNEFSDTLLGQYYRARVQQQCATVWPGNKSVLEINAGTGEDAIFLAQQGNQVLATDLSEQMVAQINGKATATGLNDQISTQVLAIEHLADLAEQFDGILSNFGGLNCVEDFAYFCQNASRLIKPGGHMVLTIMGRWVPWEWGYYLCHGEPGKAFRRVKGKTQWRDLNIYYPRLSQVKRHLLADFELIHSEGLGITMPPSYVNNSVKKYPKLFKTLALVEEKIACLPGMAHLADHYLLVYQRRQNND